MLSVTALIPALLEIKKLLDSVANVFSGETGARVGNSAGGVLVSGQARPVLSLIVEVG